MKKTVLILLGFTMKMNSLFGQTDSLSVTKFYNNLRLGAGIEKSPYLEIGFSRLGITDNGLTIGSICFYGSAQLSKTTADPDSDYMYGGKIGIETTWMILMSGAELKYLTNGNISQAYFTPRLGFSLLGFTSILYGFNLPAKSNKLQSIGQHQVSLTINLSRRLLRDFK